MKKGIILLLIWSLIFPLSWVFQRYLWDAWVWWVLQMFLRMVIPLGLFLIMQKIRQTEKIIEKKDRPTFIQRWILQSIDFVAIYFAYMYLPLWVVLLIFYIAFLLVSFMYWHASLHEKINKKKIYSLICALIGIYVMYTADTSFIRSRPAAAAAIAWWSYAINMMSSKHLNTYSAEQINTIAYAIWSIVGVWAVSIAHFIWREPITMNIIQIDTLLLSLGLWAVTFWWFYFLIEGLKSVQSQKASIILLSEVVFSFLIWWIIFSEIPNYATILWWIVIMSAVSLFVLEQEET